MHPSVFKVFEEICSTRTILGSVLEIGATPDDSTLLNLPSLMTVSEKIGINKAGMSQFKDFTILEGDANDMNFFQTNILMRCFVMPCLSTIVFSGRRWPKLDGWFG